MNPATSYINNAIFWVELEKVHPNPYQPRKEFDQAKLKDLAESIRMYGVLQPLVVTRKEVYQDGGGMTVEYELISGERRLRASKLAGLAQVPVLIRNEGKKARSSSLRWPSSRIFSEKTSTASIERAHSKDWPKNST